MPGSRASNRAAGVLALALVVTGTASPSAHRRDEYLQAARLAIDPGRVQIELDLTPGIALAETILADIDRDHDGSFSAAEQQSYGRLVLAALALAIDGTPIHALPGSMTFPGLEAIRRGEGTIRLESAAALPRLSGGLHQLSFHNTHHPDRSVYLANALVPETRQIEITAQRRDVNQTELTIDYLFRPPPPKPAAGWLFGAVAAAAALSALLIRPFRSAR